MSRSVLLFALALVSAPAQAGPWYHLDDAAELSTSDWTVGAQYGRGVGNLVMRKTRCSAAVIGQYEILTAAHCDEILWGTFSLRYSPGIYDYIRERLRMLGYPESSVTSFSDELLRKTFLTWECNQSVTIGDYDLAIWSCSPKKETGLGVFGPGDVFSPLKIRPGVREKLEVYGLSVDEWESNNVGPKVDLLAPGGIVDTSIHCSSWWDTSPWNHCFEHTARTQPGTSGGPFLDVRTDEIVGTYQAYYWEPDFDSSGWYNIGSWLPGRGGKIGHRTDKFLDEHYKWAGGSSRGGDPDWAHAPASSTFGELLDALDDERSMDPYEPLGRWNHGWPSFTLHTTSAVGGSGGTTQNFLCPQGMAARGFVASEEDHAIGNIGLICQADSWDAALLSTRTWHVVATGSAGTGGVGLVSMPYENYMSEVLVDEPAYDDQRQIVRVCPEGEYLTGATFSHSGGKIRGINYLSCAIPAASSGSLHPVGFGALVAPPSGLSCPAYSSGKRRLVTGLKVSTGDQTHAVALNCH